MEGLPNFSKNRMEETGRGKLNLVLPPVVKSLLFRGISLFTGLCTEVLICKGDSLHISVIT